MPDRAALVKGFVDAALKLMEEGLSGLSPEKAAQVDFAQRRGADISLVFAPGAGPVVAALHVPGSDVDPVEIFRVVIPRSGVSN